MKRDPEGRSSWPFNKTKSHVRVAVCDVHMTHYPGPTPTTDAMTGEVHRRHHGSPDGFYRGRQIVTSRQEEVADDE